MQPVRDWKEAGDAAVAGFARARDGGGSSSGYATAEVTNVGSGREPCRQQRTLRRDPNVMICKKSD